jgi:hypothetical protein
MAALQRGRRLYLAGRVLLKQLGLSGFEVLNAQHSEPALTHFGGLAAVIRAS